MMMRRGVTDELIKGKDGEARGVTLRRQNDGTISHIKRPIDRLVTFEIVDENSCEANKESEHQHDPESNTHKQSKCQILNENTSAKV